MYHVTFTFLSFPNLKINIKRNNIFYQEFLAKLDRPLSIPDDKITRWHPRFPLDEVPDIDPAPLPRPPDMQVYQTAKDVLAATQGKLMPKVGTLMFMSSSHITSCFRN